MLWRVLSFDLTNVIFAACFTLRGHDTRIDFLLAWVSGLPKGLGERRRDVRRGRGSLPFRLSPSPFPPETPDTQANFLWVLFLVARIGPLMHTYRSLLKLNNGFRLFNFLQSASWIWITKSDFLLSANVMVSCNVLTRWAHNLEWQMNLMGFVCVHCNWRNKFQIECSERRVFLRLAFSFN